MPTTRKPVAKPAETVAVKVPAFATVTTKEEFPKSTRTTQVASVHLPTIAAMIEGKAQKAIVESKEEADKLSNQLRQLMRRLHNRSLEAVYVPDTKTLWVRDGGDITPKPRKPAAK
jgi:hypothetical protein